MRTTVFKLLLIVAALSAFATSASAHNHQGPEGFTYCAKEHGYCRFYGVREVAYGARGHYVFRTATNGIPCKNRVFGDPIIGTRKYCYIR